MRVICPRLFLSPSDSKRRRVYVFYHKLRSQLTCRRTVQYPPSPLKSAQSRRPRLLYLRYGHPDDRRVGYSMDSSTIAPFPIMAWNDGGVYRYIASQVIAEVTGGRGGGSGAYVDAARYSTARTIPKACVTEPASWLLL